MNKTNLKKFEFKKFNFDIEMVRKQHLFLDHLIVRVDIFKPIKCQCSPHTETSQLIYCKNQLTGFYMRATLALNG